MIKTHSMRNNDNLHKTQKYAYNIIPSDIIKSMGNINKNIDDFYYDKKRETKANFTNIK